MGTYPLYALEPIPYVRITNHLCALWAYLFGFVEPQQLQTPLPARGPAMNKMARLGTDKPP